MAEKTRETSAKAPSEPVRSQENTITLRIPKPNMQVIVLGLIAFITLFQSFQLVRISGASNSTSVKAAPATNSGAGGTGAASDANTPQSMVGGC